MYDKDDFIEEEGAFFDDDGNRLNPNLVPKPTLCLSCKKDDDPREEVFCTLTRLDQTEEDEFKCFAYLNVNDKD